jgi:hypothetical protein
MPASLLIIAVAWPVGPQIGSAAAVGVVDTGVVALKEPLLLPPQADSPPSRVAPAEVPASTINALRLGELGSSWLRILDVAGLPLFLSLDATDVSLPFAGAVSDRQFSMGHASSIRRLIKRRISNPFAWPSVILNICNKTLLMSVVGLL